MDVNGMMVCIIQVKLDYPDEFLTSIRGYYSDIHDRRSMCIRSLAFESNKHKFGPYGIEQGTYFSSSLNEHTIIGFHGRFGGYVEAIGAHMKPMINKKPSKFALTRFNKYEDKLIQEDIGHYYASNPTRYSYGYKLYDDDFPLPPHDGKGYNLYNSSSNSFVHTGFNKPGDKVIQENITHYYVAKSNTARYCKLKDDDFPLPPYGNGFNLYDGSSLPPHGNGYKLQDDNFSLPPPYDPYSKQSEFSDNEKKHKIPALPPTKVWMCPNYRGSVTCGPWGGKGGTVFDDGAYTGIREIHLSRNKSIVSIKVLYDQNGFPFWGSRNGGIGGFKTDKIILDYPIEVLTHLTGYYSPIMFYGRNKVQSLTFHTTKGKYGPYGEEQGTAFSTKEGRIVGFHGRRGLFVDAIGVHVVEGKVMLPTLPRSKSLTNGDGVCSDNENHMRPTKCTTINIL